MFSCGVALSNVLCNGDSAHDRKLRSHLPKLQKYACKVIFGPVLVGIYAKWIQHWIVLAWDTSKLVRALYIIHGSHLGRFADRRSHVALWKHFAIASCCKIHNQWEESLTHLFCIKPDVKVWSSSISTAKNSCNKPSQQTFRLGRCLHACKNAGNDGSSYAVPPECRIYTVRTKCMPQEE